MRKIPVLVVMILAFASCAPNETQQSGTAGRTLAITMRDNHFEPDEVEVRRGETVSFRFINRGNKLHDAFIGDEEAQAHHEREARTNDDDHGDDHEAGNSAAITLEPGGRESLTYTFEERGRLLIGCHEPGHYADGMVVKISVK